jgi:hypothetical protein
MTDIRILTGGAPVDVLVMASTDQDTIIGNGTVSDPLRSSGVGSGTFVAQFDNPFSNPSEPRKGRPVVVTSGDPDIGICVVRTANADVGNLLPYVVGLILDPGVIGTGGGPVTVQTSGEITLTAEEWNFVVGNSQGLITGDVYYLDGSGFGQMFQNPPVSVGSAVTQIGVAISSVTMLFGILPSTVLIIGS